MSSSESESDAVSIEKPTKHQPSTDAMKSTFLNKMAQMSSKSNAMSMLMKKKAMAMNPPETMHSKSSHSNRPLKKSASKLPRLGGFDDETSSTEKSSPEKRKEKEHSSDDYKQMKKVNIISNTVIPPNTINHNGKSSRKSEISSSSCDDDSDSDVTSKLQQLPSKSQKMNTKLPQTNDNQDSSSSDEDDKSNKEKSIDDESTSEQEVIDAKEEDSDDSIDDRNAKLSESACVSTKKTRKVLRGFVSTNCLEAVNFSEQFDVVNDISNDDDVFLLKLPKQVDCDVLQGEKFDLHKQQLLKLQNAKFSFNYDKYDQSHLCIVGQTNNCDVTIRQILTKGCVTISEDFNDNDVKPVVLGEGSKVGSSEKVAFPAGLTQRHPLFGTKFKERIELDADTKLKLSDMLKKYSLFGSEDGNNSALDSKTKSKKKKKHKNKSDHDDPTQLIVEKSMVKEESVSPKRKKKEKKSKEKQFDNLTTSIISSFADSAPMPTIKKEPEMLNYESKSKKKKHSHKSKAKSDDEITQIAETFKNEVAVDETTQKRAKKKKHKHTPDNSVDVSEENEISMEKSSKKKKSKKHKNKIKEELIDQAEDNTISHKSHKKAKKEKMDTELNKAMNAAFGSTLRTPHNALKRNCEIVNSTMNGPVIQNALLDINESIIESDREHKYPKHDVSNESSKQRKEKKRKRRASIDINDTSMSMKIAKRRPTVI